MTIIPRSKIFGNPERTSCQISPDGKWLAWLAPRDGVLNIWVAQIDDISAAEPITNDEKRGIRFFMWAKNMSHLLFMQDKDGDENWHLYSVSLADKKTIDLTPYENTNASVQAMSWDEPDMMMIGMNDRDASWHDSYKVSILTGERELVFKNEDNFGRMKFDRHMNLKFLEKTIEGEGGRQLYKYDQGRILELFKISPDDELTTYLLGFQLNSSNCYMFDSDGHDKAGVVLLNWENGHRERIIDHPKADINDLIIHPTTYEMMAYGANYLKQEWHAVGDAIKDDLEFLNESLDGSFDIANTDKANKTWIIGAVAAENPGVYYQYNREEKSLVRLFSTRPELDDVRLRSMHNLVIKSRDGLELPAHLTLPESLSANGDSLPPENTSPLVLLVHGGPWARDEYGYNPQHQWLANRGYSVLSVNYRGSTGFGKSFINAADREWAGKMHDDLIDAVEWAIEQGITTRDKVAIMGGSYGGYATLVGLTFTPDTFVCGVDIVGPSSLQTLIDTIPPYWKAFYESLAKRVGDPRTEEGKQLLYDRSPLNHVEKIKKPLLIGQGANDPRVKQAESDQIVQAMKEKNIPVTYALYPDEGHGFARPENRMSFYAITEAFLGTHLGGEIEPIGDDFEGANFEVPAGAEDIPGLSDKLNS